MRTQRLVVALIGILTSASGLHLIARASGGPGVECLNLEGVFDQYRADPDGWAVRLGHSRLRTSNFGLTVTGGGIEPGRIAANTGARQENCEQLVLGGVAASKNHRAFLGRDHTILASMPTALVLLEPASPIGPARILSFRVSLGETRGQILDITRHDVDGVDFQNPDQLSWIAREILGLTGP